MNTRLLFFASSIGLGLAVAVASPAEGPIIPPTVASISPEGMQRGTTASFIIEGRSLSDASAVIFDAPGLSAKVAEITDVPEQITGPRAGVDLGAQVPLGKKQTAKLEITVAKDATPGLHRFRVRTPLGTSNLVVLAVGALPEVKRRETTEMDAGAPPQTVQLPATLIGTIAKTGEKHMYRFAGKAGEGIVFSVQASVLGSKLASMLVLSDNSGQTLATSAQNANTRDAELDFKLPRNEDYTISIADRDLEGGEGYFYRLDGGDLPYVSGVFPLGVRPRARCQVAAGALRRLATSNKRVGSPLAPFPSRRRDFHRRPQNNLSTWQMPVVSGLRIFCWRRGLRLAAFLSQTVDLARHAIDARRKPTFAVFAEEMDSRIVLVEGFDDPHEAELVGVFAHRSFPDILVVTRRIPSAPRQLNPIPMADRSRPFLRSQYQHSRNPIRTRFERGQNVIGELLCLLSALPFCLFGHDKSLLTCRLRPTSATSSIRLRLNSYRPKMRNR